MDRLTFSLGASFECTTPWAFLFFLSRAKPKLVFGVYDQVRHKPGRTTTVKTKMALCLKFWIYEVEGLFYLCSENKEAQISCTATPQLTCAFVFASAKSRFSYDTAHNIQDHAMH